MDERTIGAEAFSGASTGAVDIADDDDDDEESVKASEAVPMDLGELPLILSKVLGELEVDGDLITAGPAPVPARIKCCCCC